MNKHVTIVGTGLIGGSLAKAIRKSGFAGTIVGADRDEASLKMAIELGVIDRYSIDLTEAVAGADIVVLAVPVRQTGAVLSELLPGLSGDSVVTDVGSSKAKSRKKWRHGRRNGAVSRSSRDPDAARINSSRRDRLGYTNVEFGGC